MAVLKTIGNLLLKLKLSKKENVLTLFSNSPDTCNPFGHVTLKLSARDSDENRIDRKKINVTLFFIFT